MATKSEFSVVGLVHKVCLSAEKQGYTPDLLNALAEDPNLFTQLLEVQRGNAEIKPFDFWRTVEDLAIPIPALGRLEFKSLKKQFDWIKRIEADTSPTEAVVLRLGTVLRLDEGSVNNTEYERRRTMRHDFLLGYQQAAWLVEHQDEFPAFMALLGKIYIDFPGLVVVGADGYRHFPYLCRLGGRWCLFWGWAGSGLVRGGRVASK